MGAVHTFLLWSAILTATSCVEEPTIRGNAHVEITFELEAASAMDGMLVINDAYLKVDHLTVVGNSGGENTTNVTASVPPEDPPYRLSHADSSHIGINLPFRQYNQLDLILYLYQDSHELKFPEDPIEEVPPADNDGDTPVKQGDAGGDDEGTTDNGGNAGGDEQGDSSKDNHDGGHDEDDDGDGDHDEGNDGDHGDGDDGVHDDDDDEGDSDDKGDKGDKDDKGNKGDKGDKGDKNDKGDKGDKGEKDDKGDKGHHHDDDDDEDEDDEDEDDEDDDGRVGSHFMDLDDFFRSAKPSILVFGTYQSNNLDIDVIVAVSGVEKLVLPAQQNGDFSVVLSENNSAAISFDPVYWFGLLTTSEIESGSLQSYHGRRVLFIHKDFNQALYEKLAPRLQESVTFNVASDH